MEYALLSRNPSLHLVPDASVSSKDPKAKLRASAQQFEQVYLNTMLGQMFAGLTTEGPFHAGQAEETWRGMLIDEYAKSISQRGGVGIADAVYRDLLRVQEGKN